MDREAAISIKGTDLTEAHIGKTVFYVPYHALVCGVVIDSFHPDIETRYITSWNDKYVFVRFPGYGSSAACDTENLFLSEE